MRCLAVLLFLAVAATAKDDVEELLEEEQFDEARQLAEQLLESNPTYNEKAKKKLKEQRAKAVRGQARDLHRARGYDAAIAFLEKNLTHWLIAQAFAETCLWAGREEYGIVALKRSSLGPGDWIIPELRLLAQLRRYDEVVVRAQQVQRELEWDVLAQYESFGRAEAAMRKRLLAGAERGHNAARFALLVILGAAALVYRCAPPISPSKRGAA